MKEENYQPNYLEIGKQIVVLCWGYSDKPEEQSGREALAKLIAEFLRAKFERHT